LCQLRLQLGSSRLSCTHELRLRCHCRSLVSDTVGAHLDQLCRELLFALFGLQPLGITLRAQLL